MNQLILGNAFEVLENLPDHRGILITAPPYANTSLKFDKNKFDWQDLWDLINLKTRDDSIQLIFSQIVPALNVINANRKYFHYQIVWQKKHSVGFLNCKTHPLKSHELILCFSRKISKSIYNPQFSKGEPYSCTPAKQATRH